MTTRELETEEERNFNQSEPLDFAGNRRSAYYFTSVIEHH